MLSRLVEVNVNGAPGLVQHECIDYIEDFSEAKFPGKGADAEGAVSVPYAEVLPHSEHG